MFHVLLVLSGPALLVLLILFLKSKFTWREMLAAFPLLIIMLVILFGLYSVVTSIIMPILNVSG